MKIISFIEARQGEVIRKMLEDCGLWKAPPPRVPPKAVPPPSRAMRRAQGLGVVEMDGDYLEHLRREQQAEQLELPWDD